MQDDGALENASLPPQYPEDDTRPTSKKELAGWYSYGWAAEVFTVCAMGMCRLHENAFLCLPGLMASLRIISSHHLGANGTRQRSSLIR